jgi:hypothetical protein
MQTKRIQLAERLGVVHKLKRNLNLGVWKQRID